MLPIDPNAPAQGNREVCEILESWLARARLGKINFVGIVACEGQTAVFKNHAGIPETYFAAYFGLDNMKKELADILVGAPCNGATGSGPADRVCYDLAVEPCSFDFLVWLLTAEMRRIREGAPAPLKVAFLNEHFPTGWHRGMYETVIRPAVALMGGVVDQSHASTGRRLNSYTCLDLVKAARAGEEIPQFFGNGLPGYDSGYVTITLREAKHWPHRNSNVEEWLRFADYLNRQGERVVFIRDTDKGEERFQGRETNVRAASDLAYRLDLYERAKCNLFVPNGPATLCQFGVAPWIMFWKPDPADPYAPNRPEWLKDNAGIEEGEQFPWSGPHQRIAWATDTFENIVAAWEDWNAGI